jgi:hypothetical protein
MSRCARFFAWLMALALLAPAGCGSNAAGGRADAAEDSGLGDAAVAGTGGRGGVSGTGGSQTSGRGGASGAGGLGGGAGGGGGAPPSATCPNAPPAMDEECASTGMICQWGQAVCRCLAGSPRRWTCASTTCPVAAPPGGGPCALMGLGSPPFCRYGLSLCTCSASMWRCDACPVAAEEGRACTASAGTSCTYPGIGVCFCSSGTWSCN